MACQQGEERKFNVKGILDATAGGRIVINRNERKFLEGHPVTCHPLYPRLEIKKQRPENVVTSTGL